MSSRLRQGAVWADDEGFRGCGSLALAYVLGSYFAAGVAWFGGLTHWSLAIAPVTSVRRNFVWRGAGVLLAVAMTIPDRMACRADAAEPSASRPRVLILTDIGDDPDDQQCLVRLLVHANEFDIEGLIATGVGLGQIREQVTRPDLILEQVEAYEQVCSSLARHAPGFPAPDELRRVVKSGSPLRGRKAIGAAHDTDGSNWIIACADRADPRPLHIGIWGGQTDLAQALWRVRQDRGAAGLQKFISNLRVHDIEDQDHLAEWIWQEFPGMFYILDKAPPGEDKRLAVNRGFYLGGDLSLTSRAWIDEHIRSGHGPLGALYPRETDTYPSPQGGVKEADVLTALFLFSNGLGDPDHPEWGSWGGRYELAHDRVYRDAIDAMDGIRDARATVWRWRPDFQNEFMARMDWCVQSREAANHPPVPILNGRAGTSVLELRGRPGASLTLSADGSHDPDGDLLRPRWWVYPEAGTYRGEVILGDADSLQALVTIPPDAAGTTIHVILSLTDAGSPSLTRYRRAIVVVEEP